MKIKIEGAIYDTSKTEEPHYYFYHLDMSKSWATVMPYTIEVEIPDDINMVPQKVAIMESARADVVAEFTKKLFEIDEAISKLQCLTNEVQA
jgi:hypothetical protein